MVERVLVVVMNNYHTTAGWTDNLKLILHNALLV